MERRKFIKSGIAVSTIPMACATSTVLDNKTPIEITNELYEWRTYDIKWGANSKMLTSYLTDTLKPAMMRAGANHFMVFDEIAPGGPKKIYVLISYPDANTYVTSQNLQSDRLFIEAASEYDAIPVDNPIYNRYSSSLLRAFDGLKQMLTPVEGATVYELRIYEGYSEDAVRRKINMFNNEEIDLFPKVGLNHMFYGDMISGPYRPCLVYMLNFTDMEAHAAAWKAFSKAPEWNEMKVKPEYANTVSNIRNVFLRQV